MYSKIFFIWMHAYCLGRRDCHCSRACHIFMLTHISGIGDWILWLYLATLLKVVIVTHGPMHRVLWLASACERHPTFFENNMKPESFATQLMFCACVFIFQTSAYSTIIISVFSAIPSFQASFFFTCELGFKWPKRFPLAKSDLGESHCWRQPYWNQSNKKWWIERALVVVHLRKIVVSP